MFRRIIHPKRPVISSGSDSDEETPLSVLKLPPPPTMKLPRTVIQMPHTTVVSTQTAAITTPTSSTAIVQLSLLFPPLPSLTLMPSATAVTTQTAAISTPTSSAVIILQPSLFSSSISPIPSISRQPSLSPMPPVTPLTQATLAATLRDEGMYPSLKMYQCYYEILAFYLIK